MNTLNQNDLRAIREEVIKSFTTKEIKLLNNFEAFFDLVDVQNADEEGWEKLKEKYRPYYEKVWMELITGELSHE
jgi:hypothetical protein